METISVMYEEGNLHMRLQQRLTNRLQMLRDGRLSDSDFRLAESIGIDMEIYKATGGGLLQRVGDTETFVSMPRASGPCSAPQERQTEALERIGRSYAALAASSFRRRTADMSRADFNFWILSDPPVRQFERRAKLSSGHGLQYVYWMLDTIGALQIYDSVRWRVIIRGEASVAA